MSARMIRIKKEARALFWPWCAVVIAGALPPILRHYGLPRFIGNTNYAEALPFLGFVLGIPLLATLSLGNEFQYRTISLWLSQPSGRMQLWGEKLSVTFAAVLSAAAVGFGIGPFSIILNQESLTVAVAAIVFVIVALASATFWTLTARSTIGGVGLNVMQFVFFEAVVYLGWELGLDLSAAIKAASVLGICYAGLMLWLGARKLARFQLAGGSAGDDLLMAGPSVMPEALAGWFRCRPSGAFLNLVRKELRLLRPLWLITLLVSLGLAGLAMFRLLPDPARETPPRTLTDFAVGIVVLFLPVMAILAGTLSLGEERTSGTQAWHMTLPVSARRQWFIKLVMAVLAGLACAVLLPLLVLMACGSIFGSPFMFVNFQALPALLFVIPLLSIASFWCACATNGTIRAALWVFPVTAAIFFAGTSGVWLGQELARTTGTLKDLAVSWFHLSPLSFPNDWYSRASQYPRPEAIPTRLFVAFGPAVLFGVIQSYRLFRTQPSDRAVWMARCLWPLATVSILWCLFLSAGFLSSGWEPFFETRNALEQLQPGMRKLELTGDDLAKGAPLSFLTRRWLAGSSINVAPDYSHSSAYLATIHLASGLDCRLSVGHYGGMVFSPEKASCGSKGP